MFKKTEIIKAMKNDTAKIVIIALLVINILLGGYIAFLKPSSYSLEALKAGGRQNMKMAKQLYTSDTYVQQQRSTLEQILGTLSSANIPSVEDMKDIEDAQVNVEDNAAIDIEKIELE